MSDDFTRLKCDVEMEVSAPSIQTANKWTADALRRLADRVETGELNDGFEPVTDGAGKEIGQVYVDYSGTS